MVFVCQIEIGGVVLVVVVEIVWQWDFWMWQVGLVFLLCQFFYCVDWVGYQFVQWQGIVCDMVDERGIGVVFQQMMYQICQQCFVGVYWGVDVVWLVQFVVGDFVYYLFVQWFVYVVQVLEFILVWVVVLVCQLVDSCQSMSVMGGELWVNQVWYCQQFFCVGEVGDVGVNFVGVYWIVFEIFYLCVFNFVILVGVFYQMDYQVMVVVGGEVNQVINDKWIVFLVGLNYEVNFVLVGQFWFEVQFFQQVEGDFQMVCFFGVNIDVDVILVCQQGQ